MEMIGKQISQYRIEEKLGEGGMGIVYKATDTRLHRSVILKFLRPEFTKDEEAKERLIHEARAASRLEHANICSIYEIEETAEGHSYIVMGYYCGETVNKRIRETLAGQPFPFSVDETVSIALQTARGLSHAHEKGIIHRDIKPANLIITHRGEVKILDFGLARMLGDTRITKDGSIFGTVSYMSPEQAEGEEVDYRTDIWSLGVVMYEMITGRLPFSGNSELQVLNAILKKTPDSIRKIRPEVPEALERIIEKTLCKAREKSYRDINELVIDLQLLYKQGDTQPISGKTRFSFPIQLSWKRFYLLIFFISLVTGSLFFLFLNPNFSTSPEKILKKREKNSLLILYFENLTGNPKFDYLEKTIAHLLINSLMQSKYIRVVSSDRLQDVLQEMHLANLTSFNHETVQKISRRTRSSYILKGQIFKSGNAIRLSSSVQNPEKNQTVLADTFQGQDENSIFSLVDEIAARVKRSFSLSPKEIAGDIHGKIVKINTASAEAMKLYVEGYDLYSLNKFEASNQSFQKALFHDPDFSLAYWRMAINFSYLGQLHKEKIYIRKALQGIERLSLRDRYLIQGYADVNLDNNISMAIKHFHQLLELYPDDEEGLFNLGNVYRNIEAWDQAQQQYERILSLSNRSAPAILNLATIYNIKGKTAEALELMQMNQDLFPRNCSYHRHLSRLYFFLGKQEEAIEEAKKALELDKTDFYNQELLGNLYILRGNFPQAEEWYGTLQRHPDPLAKFLGFTWAAHLSAIQGKLIQSIKQMEAALDITIQNVWDYYEISLKNSLAAQLLQLDRSREAERLAREAEQKAVKYHIFDEQLRSLQIQALSMIQDSRRDKAEEIAQKIQRLLEKEEYVQHRRHFLLYVQASIQLHKGLISEAQKKFQSAIELLPHECFNRDHHALYFDSLAHAFYLKKDLHSAKKTYEAIQQLSAGRLEWGAIYAKSFYWLGVIEKKLGNRIKAEEYLQKFLRLWENLDFFSREHQEAEKELNLLQNR